MSKTKHPKSKGHLSKEGGVPMSQTQETADTGAAPRKPPRETMIAEAAYYLSKKRGFVPGYELDDWLSAEAIITDSALQEDQAARELH